MSLTNIKDLSDFAKAALSLDSEFAQLERLSGQLERLDLDSESDLEHARKLLSRFGETGQKVGEGIQVLARTLEESRVRAEKAAEVVSARAGIILERQQKAETLLTRFQTLAEKVREMTVSVSQFQKPPGSEFSQEERDRLTQHIPEMDTKLVSLIDESMEIKADASAARMKTLEKNADSLGQSLVSVRSRLGQVKTQFKDRPQPSGDSSTLH